MCVCVCGYMIVCYHYLLLASIDIVVSISDGAVAAFTSAVSVIVFVIFLCDELTSDTICQQSICLQYFYAITAYLLPMSSILHDCFLYHIHSYVHAAIHINSTSLCIKEFKFVFKTVYVCICVFL